MILTADELEHKAEQILRDAGAFEVPVPIDRVARHLNLTIEAVHLEDIAGVLVVNGESGSIAYNSAHSAMRRRFTVAHEISHFLLHTKRDEKPQIFIDRRVSCCLPGEDVNSAVFRVRAEASQFGAALLMPRTAVLKRIESDDSDLDDDEAIKSLSSRFLVSVAAMAKRLKNLGVLLL